VVDTTTAYAARLRIDVKDNIITFTNGKDVRVDHYSVVQEDTTKTVIATESDGDKDPQTFIVVDPKTMKWNVAPGASIIFTKEP
jgi:hypothetical protein